MLKLHARSTALFCLILLQIFTVSCNRETSPEFRQGTEYEVKLLGNNHVDGKLTKSTDDRVKWTNDTDKDFVVCFHAADDKHPFEAFVWYVPKHKQRKSGKIRGDATLKDYEYSVYDASTMIHMCEPSGSVPVTIPKIIIQ